MVTIDLQHLGRPQVTAAYLLDELPEPVLIDCGTTASLPALTAALAARGLALTDVCHLLLTHAHLDHAGAAGALVAAHPELRVHVSELGARHLIAPERLERSARRLFGAQFERICGALVPVPEAAVEVIAGGPDAQAAGLAAFPTPGHAIHHVSYLDADGSCYVGDVTGVRIAPHRYLLPGTPPPDIDAGAYERSFQRIEGRRPARLCLSHYGVVEDPAEHLALMRARLADWIEQVRRGVGETAFVAAGEAELALLDPAVAEPIAITSPFRSSYAGLRRYWDTREGAG